jgi:hypothetical protein
LQAEVLAERLAEIYLEVISMSALGRTRLTLLSDTCHLRGMVTLFISGWDDGG